MPSKAALISAYKTQFWHYAQNAGDASTRRRRRRSRYLPEKNVVDDVFDENL